MVMDPPSSHDDPEPATEKPPEWDNDWAKWLLGQYALVGITRMAADRETVRSIEQHHGRIVAVNRRGVTIACEGHWQGKTVKLPPDQRAFSPARPGQYCLKSTGELVNDPDIVTSWTIYDTAASEPDSQDAT
jgi:hypothetical protein